MFKTKVLTGAEYEALKTKADNYDAVVNAIVANNEGLTAEDVTPEVISEALSATEGGNAETLQTQLDAAEQRATTAEARVTELETENANLKNSAGEAPAVVEAKGGEPTGEKKTIVDFATEHAGDTAAIMGKLREEGYK